MYDKSVNVMVWSDYTQRMDYCFFISHFFSLLTLALFTFILRPSIYLLHNFYFLTYWQNRYHRGDLVNFRNFSS